jgi:hypothetical protein
MLWKVALYLALAWGILCTVLTVTFFTRVGIEALRTRLRHSPAKPVIVPVDQTALLTTQPNRRRPG